MNKIILVFCAVLLVSTAINANGIQLTIAYEDKEQPPYYMGNTHEILDEKPGAAVEMVMMLSHIIEGVEIKLVRFPWKRCLYSLKGNTVDGIFNASYKKKRLEFGWYPTINRMHDGPVDTSRRITKISYSFYTLKNTQAEWDG